MSLTETNCEVVYFRVMITKGGFVQLSAKLDEETSLIWIKPWNPALAARQLQMHGFESRDSQMFLRNKKLPTVSLKTALKMFHGFLRTSPKPVILVSHCADMGAMRLLRAIQITNTVPLFRGVIAGFSDTVLILRKKLPGRKDLKQFRFPVLIQDYLGKRLVGEYYESVPLLDHLKELVDLLVSKLDLINNIQPYEEAIVSEDVDDSMMLY